MLNTLFFGRWVSAEGYLRHGHTEKSELRGVFPPAPPPAASFILSRRHIQYDTEHRTAPAQQHMQETLPVAADDPQQEEGAPFPAHTAADKQRVRTLQPRQRLKHPQGSLFLGADRLPFNQQVRRASVPVLSHHGETRLTF